MRFLILLISLLLAQSAGAQIGMGSKPGGSAVNGFTYCRQAKVDHLKVSNTVFPPADLSNFVVLFDSAIDPELQNELRLLSKFGGVVTNSSGFDIVFYPDALGGAGAAKLDHEINFFYGPTGRLIAHIRMDISAAVDTLFWICYGKSSITTSQQNISGTWHSSYKAVWHFGDAVTVSLANSTSNTITGANVNGVTATGGKVGGAAQFTRAANQRISLGTPTALGSGLQGSRTVSFWYHLDSAPSGTNLYNVYFKAGEEGGMQLLIGTGANTFVVPSKGATGFLTTSSFGRAAINENVTPMAGDTKHVSMIYDRTAHTIYLYVNCVLVATYDYWPGVFNGDNTATIGGAGTTTAFDGWIDEMTISDVARPKDYVVTACRMEQNPGLMVSVGPKL